MQKVSSINRSNRTEAKEAKRSRIFLARATCRKNKRYDPMIQAHDEKVQVLDEKVQY
jgi:hypothetical protein